MIDSNIPATTSIAINVCETVAAIQALTQATRYPVARCIQNRRTAIAQARKHRDAGNIAKTLEWIGYAVYWSGRARKRLETVDETQARTDARMAAMRARMPVSAVKVPTRAEIMAPISAPAVPLNGDYSLANLLTVKP